MKKHRGRPQDATKRELICEFLVRIRPLPPFRRGKRGRWKKGDEFSGLITECAKWVDSELPKFRRKPIITAHTRTLVKTVINELWLDGLPELEVFARTEAERKYHYFCIEMG